LRFFSDAKRPVHMGPYPTERLVRSDLMPSMEAMPAMRPLEF
jgi:hypothetical protein